MKVMHILLGGAACMGLALTSACSGQGDETPDSGTETSAEAVEASTTPAPDSIDTLDGSQFANFTGDASAGAAVFAQCRACHVVDAGVNRTGPSLHAIVGSEAGHVDGFRYSDANANSGIIWTPEKLFQYLEDPRRIVPGTRMAFRGISDPQDRANLIAYLETQ